MRQLSSRIVNSSIDSIRDQSLRHQFGGEWTLGMKISRDVVPTRDTLFRRWETRAPARDLSKTIPIFPFQSQLSYPPMTIHNDSHTGKSQKNANMTTEGVEPSLFRTGMVIFQKS